MTKKSIVATYKRLQLFLNLKNNFENLKSKTKNLKPKQSTKW